MTTNPLDALLSGISPEQRARTELAAVCRILGNLGWTKLIFNHVTVRCPNEPGLFLINPFGVFFEQVRASDIVKVNLEGEIVGSSQWPVSRAGWVIHSAVYAARPDINATIHTHSEGVGTLSTLQTELLPLSLEAVQFYNRIGYHEFEGLSHDVDERAVIARDLGENVALILRNHGALVTGETLAEAFHLNHNLEHAARLQVAAHATNQPLKLLSDSVSRHSVSQVAGKAYRSNPVLAGAIRHLDAVDSSFRL